MWKLRKTNSSFKICSFAAVPVFWPVDGRNCPGAGGRVRLVVVGPGEGKLCNLQNGLDLFFAISVL